jgi:hypothetical protein
MDPPNLLTGEPGRSDPYLVLKLGKTIINERKNYAEDRSDVDIFRVRSPEQPSVISYLSYRSTKLSTHGCT